MDPSLCQWTFNNINHVKSALFKAIERNDADCIRNLLSNNIVTQLDSRKKFGLCAALLSEAMWKNKMVSFEALLAGAPLKFLNTPQQWPGETDDFTTTYDRLFNSLYRKDPAYEEKAISYGLKSLKQLLDEGYILPKKLEYNDTWNRWVNTGKWIND